MLVISDLHWRTDTPAWRKEPYYGVVLRHKLCEVLAQDEAVVVAGDVFHRADDFAAVFDLFTFLKDKQACLYAVRGQHDMVLHSNTVAETGFNLLVEAGLIIPLGAEPSSIENFTVCGMGWDEPIPERSADILIAHVPVSYAGAAYNGAESAMAFRAKAAKFNLVFTGDNHKRFSTVNGLYNAGCFHRMTADLEGQVPAAWHVTSKGVSLFEIPCLPPVIDIAYRDAQSKGSKAVAGVEFVKALSDARQQGGGDVFLAALKKAVEEADGGTRELLKDLVKLCEEAHT